jgi:ferritin-like metal-binding protein YciE
VTSTTSNELVIKHLEDVHAIEMALVQTLTAHIGVTPEGEYRSLLERHLQETNEQAQRIRERLGALGATGNPLDVARTVVTTIVGQVLAAAKAPVDLLRGPSGEEKLLRNARDEIVTEALEIGAYDALEHIAKNAGDEKTVTLAREHRTQEEVMLKDLRAQMPKLARAAYLAEAKGEMSYDASETGAAQAVKGVARTAQGKLTSDGDGGGASGGSAFGPDQIAAMPVDRALKAIDAIEDGEELAHVEAAERQGKNRDRVLARLRRRREQVAGVA